MKYTEEVDAIVRRIVRRRYYRFRDRCTRDDMLQAARLYVIQYMGLVDETHPRMRQYIEAIARTGCMRHVYQENNGRKENGVETLAPPTISLSLPLGTDLDETLEDSLTSNEPTADVVLHNARLAAYARKILERQPKRRGDVSRKMLADMYNADKGSSYVAHNEGVSRQAINTPWMAALRRARAAMESRGMTP